MNHTVRPDLIHLAILINRFRLSNELPDFYGQAISSYDAILEIIENQRSAIKLALMAEMPVSKVGESVEAILDFLLFNKEKDPYISLGLRGDEDESEIMKRWRRLITLFHPDKYPGSKVFEEKAKRINEAYEAIKRSNERKKREFKSVQNKCDRYFPLRIDINASKSDILKNRNYGKRISRRNQGYSGFLRKLPFIITVIMLFISFLAVFLLIKRF